MKVINKKFWEGLSRKITILVVPHPQWKPLRMECSMAFLLFGLALWSGLTVWAGFISGRHVDYWITKADNEIMMAKFSRMSREMDESWRILATAQSTDHQMRSLLDITHHDNNQEAVGGPTEADRLALQRMLTGDVAGVNQSAWHRQAAAIKAESYKRLSSFQEIAWHISNQRNLFHATPNMWPTEGHVTSLFGYRFNPMRRGDDENLGEFHPGVDIANSPDTLIFATADGTVRFAGWSHGYGQMVMIDHGYGISTVYGHSSKLLVKTGDHVWRNQAIAYMGTTGRSTGAHLHYEIRQHDKPVNPMMFLKVRAGANRAQSLAEAVPTEDSQE